MSVSHTPGTQAHAHPELSFLRKYIFSEDHKIIGIQFLISGLIFFLIGGTLPLMVGARDMAFPKLNMMSYWFMWPAFLIILSSFIVEGGAPGAGWTSYPTLASATMHPGAGFNSPASPHTGLG